MPKEEEITDPEEAMNQLQPLITKNMERNPSFNKSVSDVRFKNFNEDEESTRINRITCLHVAYWKIIIVVPLLALCTGFFFLLFLYWKVSLRKKFFYSECRLEQATHLLIEGTCKYPKPIDIHFSETCRSCGT